MSAQAQRVEDFARRTIDIVASAGGLAVLAVPMVAVAVAVKVSSPGPVFFTQERVGKDGEHFNLIKFRSMRPAVDDTAAQVTAGGDPRITKIGGFLRNWKLDELPQLFNVLKGDMSLVGPRPEVPRYTPYWPKQYADIILTVRPGITNPVTVELRDQEELLAGREDPERFYIDQMLPEKARKYAEYVQARTLAGDLRTIFHTIKAVARL
ncbi:sugar transferase [Corynebacterium pseudopelargi]|uniref:Undecaprenyl-phosphate N-acetylgalactosaminyl 1-phosphate transferase n=1 Tax=Corynebacterium pseudopelargi TaxID=2080757 RepID=A0A3G6IRN3_9CORY|nr:sugar transferase [Corynebacterium pseudopelargi]AZA08249.1 Putative undecaprenyl-phosphate N-acetylgalactosaminyl 1-phosphate transferase [Corynebacterium pseudopelargi]